MVLLNHKNEKNVIAQFDTVNQAALAILALDNFELNNGFKIKIMYYLTKFCNHFLNNKECLNQNCLFIHTANINEYQYERITNPNQLNSFQFALDVLNIPKNIFEIKSATPLMTNATNASKLKNFFELSSFFIYTSYSIISYFYLSDKF